MGSVSLSDNVKKALNKLRPVTPKIGNRRFTYATIIIFLIKYYYRREREDAISRRAS